MNAKEANKIASDQAALNNQKALDDIYSKISAYAKNGWFTCSVDHPLSESMHQKLLEDGYKIEILNNQHVCYEVRISWENAAPDE